MSDSADQDNDASPTQQLTARYSTISVSLHLMNSFADLIEATLVVDGERRLAHGAVRKAAQKFDISNSQACHLWKTACKNSDDPTIQSKLHSESAKLSVTKLCSTMETTIQASSRKPSGPVVAESRYRKLN